MPCFFRCEAVLLEALLLRRHCLIWAVGVCMPDMGQSGVHCLIWAGQGVQEEALPPDIDPPCNVCGGVELPEQTLLCDGASPLRLTLLLRFPPVFLSSVMVRLPSVLLYVLPHCCLSLMLRLPSVFRYVFPQYCISPLSYSHATSPLRLLPRLPSLLCLPSVLLRLTASPSRRRATVSFSLWAMSHHPLVTPPSCCVLLPLISATNHPPPSLPSVVLRRPPLPEGKPERPLYWASLKGHSAGQACLIARRISDMRLQAAT